MRGASLAAIMGVHCRFTSPQGGWGNRAFGAADAASIREREVSRGIGYQFIFGLGRTTFGLRILDCPAVAVSFGLSFVEYILSW